MSRLKKEYKNWNTGTSFSKKQVFDKDVTVNKDIAENLNSLFTKNWIYFGSEHSNNIKPFMKLLYFSTQGDHKICFL